MDKDDVIDALSEASDRTFTPRVVRWAVAIGKAAQISASEGRVIDTEELRRMGPAR